VLKSALAPQFLAGECGALGQHLKLRPGDLGMNAAAEAAIGAGDDVFAADDLGVAHDAVGADLGALDDVAGMADYARDQKLSIRQLDVLPHPPFVLVANIAGLHRIRTGVDAQNEIDDVPQWNVRGVRTVPAAPAYVEADAVGGQAAQRMVQRS